MNDPTAQMGFQVGKSAMAAGQEYMENNVCTIDISLLPLIANLEIIYSSIAMSLYPLSSTTLTSPTPTS
jgi:hypothetical protein